MSRLVNIHLKISTMKLNLLFCALVLGLANLSFWQHAISAFPVAKGNLGFLGALGVLVASLYFVLLSVFSNKYLFKPVLIFLLISSAISAYFMDSYGYIISAQTFENVFATDTREVQDLLTLKFAVYIIGLGLVPSFLVYFSKIKYPSFKTKMAYLLIAVLIGCGDILLFKRSYTSFLRNHKVVRYYLNPIRPVYALIKFSLQLTGTYSNNNSILVILDPQPRLAPHSGKPRLVVLVVGEADRAANHQLNGYKRQTNPLLSQRADLYNFSNFYSCGTETSVSVPCMFSVYPREQYTGDKGRYTENLLDLLQKAQVQVLWRDNDSGCKNVCDRVAIDDFNDAKIAPYCNSFECHDEVLLHKLQDYIAHDVGDKIIVLHKKGNHGPAYYKRYPSNFELFKPTCQSSELQDCNDSEIVNAYDNIVLYTDYFLDKVIKQLEVNSAQYQSAMIYVSDHGESLGEHNIYLHAMPYWIAPREQIHIPFMFWASPDFAIDRQHLARIQQQQFSHDNLFHSVLGLFAVDSKVYDNSLDMFKKG